MFFQYIRNGFGVDITEVIMDQNISEAANLSPRNLIVLLL